MHSLTKFNYSLHEASHIAACCWHNLACDAEIGIDLDTEQGHVSVMTWHDGGTIEDDLVVLSAGGMRRAMNRFWCEWVGHAIRCLRHKST